MALFLLPEKIRQQSEDNYFENNIPQKYKNNLPNSMKIKSLRNILIILTILEIFASFIGLGYYFLRRVSYNKLNL